MAPPWRSAVGAAPPLKAPTQVATGVPMIRAGQVRGVAVSGPKRNPALPDLPAVAESIPGFDVQTWYILLAPKGIDPNIQMKLNQAVEKVLSSPAAKTLLQDQGLEWAPITPKQVEEFIASEQQKYSQIVRASGAKVE